MTPILFQISQRPFTLALVLSCLAVYLVLGPATDPARFVTLPELLLGVWRHGNLSHLVTNIVVLAIGGALCEPHLRRDQLAVLVAVCAGGSTLVELILGGPGFVGISAVAYGLAAHGLLLGKSIGKLLGRDWGNIAMLLGVVIAEAVLLNKSVSVYAHATGILIGGGSAMLGSLFGTKGPVLKKMEWKHVADAVAIIAETDEDDAREAEQVFVNGGYERMLVLVDRGEVMGLTGYDLDAQVPDLAWLSWTYMGQEYQNEGHGSQMLNDLLGRLAKQGVRKIFIETSDYAEMGEPIYAKAHKMYEDFGAEIELTLPDYHAPGEAKLIYGLNNPEAPETPDPLGHEDDGISLTGFEIAAETRDIAGVTWEEAPSGLRGADFLLSKVRDKGHRYAVLAIPSDLSIANHDTLVTAGFTQAGVLKSYYGSHVDQHWWIGH